MIYKKNKNGEAEDLKEISYEEAFQLMGTGDLVFDSHEEEINFYKEVLNQYLFPKRENASSKLDNIELSHDLENEKLLSKKENTSDKSHISELLPYLENEELHEIVLSIGNEEDSRYENLDYEELIPYLEDADADLLFFKALDDKRKKPDVEALAFYVSEDAFTKLIDEFLNGKYQDVNLDVLYPYMKSSDIKRLFDYYSSKKSDI